jgi:hypothetical protein
VLSTTGLALVVVLVLVLVVELVNDRLGCDTLPGAWSSTNATAPPAMSSSTTAAMPQRRRRRGPGLGMPVMLVTETRRGSGIAKI